jgi:hypothetical protein
LSASRAWLPHKPAGLGDAFGQAYAITVAPCVCSRERIAYAGAREGAPKARRFPVISPRLLLKVQKGE